MKQTNAYCIHLNVHLHHGRVNTTRFGKYTHSVTTHYQYICGYEC